MHDLWGLALWDMRGKATGWPLYRLLGGGPRAIPEIDEGFLRAHPVIDEPSYV